MTRMSSSVPRIEQLSVVQLKAMIDEGRKFEIFDVRTPDERAMAHIEGSHLVDDHGYKHLLSLDRETPIVLQCHHGVRSQSAAEYCVRELGFTTVYNLSGGIDAWSLYVDPSVPRY